MAKYNILVVTSTLKSGVEYHRQLAPHAYLRGYTDFDVSTINEIDSESFIHNGEVIQMNEFLKNFQLVQFSRTISYEWKIEETISKLNKMGIVSVMDIDDYWNYGSDHVLYDQHIHDEVPGKSLLSIKYVDHITTTTDFFMDKIKFYNKNVSVLENAINTNDPQFKQMPTESDVVRFGWMGSQCHIQDISILSKSLFEMNAEGLTYNVTQCGYVPNEVGKFFDKVLTGSGSIRSGMYKQIEWKDSFSYATSYNEIDVVLAPLADSLFNNCKSEIKLIEAGFMKKGAIVSKIFPYKIIGENNKNCLMVKPNKPQDWKISFKKYINNPNLISDHAEQLYEDVKIKYHMSTVTKKRADLYIDLIEKKNK